jgi:hypothetical protein
VRRGLLPFAVLAACLTAGTAGATSTTTIPARSAVTALAADGTDTSFAATSTTTDCDRVFLWQATARRPVQFGKKQRCKSKSLGITALAVTKGRVLWVTATGSPVATVNLWTASTTKPTPKALATATRDIQANDPVPIVVGSAGGGLLPYAQGVTVSVLRSDGRKAFSWLAPGRVLALAARNGRVAVGSEGSRVTVLDGRGNVVSVDLFESEVTDVAMTAKGLLVQRGATLELRREADANEYPMTGNAQLADADAKLAAWSDGRLVHLIRLPDGAQLAAYPGTSAAIAGTTLYVANGKTITSRVIR